MLSWFRLGHPITKDLPDLARIIQAQKPGSLQWATDRLWEFHKLYAIEYDLSPSECRNGFDWSGRYGVDTSNLAFFDQVYEVESASVRFSLQMVADPGHKPQSFIQIYFNVNEPKSSEEDEIDDEWIVTNMVLEGVFGKKWFLRASFRYHEGEYMQQLAEVFPDDFVKDVVKDKGVALEAYACEIDPEHVHEALESMVRFLYLRLGRPFPQS